jgi:hypothetical protein
VYAAVVTADGTYRFAPTAANAAPTIARIADPARDVTFGHDGTLYLVFADRVVAYDRDLRARWTIPLRDGRRVLVAKRIVV